MPQCTNRKANDNPFGKGSIPNELLEVTFRTRRRAAKINEGEDSKRRLYEKMLERHHNAQTERNARVMEKCRQSLKEKEAYRKVLKSFSADNFTTLRWGFRQREISSPQSFRRYKVETRIYNCGFSPQTLKQEMSATLDMSRPEKKKNEFINKLLQVCKRRSDFKIDRRLTNEGIRKEHEFAMKQIGFSLISDKRKNQSGVSGQVSSVTETLDKMTLQEDKPLSMKPRAPAQLHPKPEEVHKHHV